MLKSLGLITLIAGIVPLLLFTLSPLDFFGWFLYAYPVFALISVSTGVVTIFRSNERSGVRIMAGIGIVASTIPLLIFVMFGRFVGPR